MCGCERAVISEDSVRTLFQHPFDQIIFDSDDIHIRLGPKPELLFQVHIQSQVKSLAEEIRSATSQAEEFKSQTTWKRKHFISCIQLNG